MRKLFGRITIGAILVATLSGGVAAHPTAALFEEKDQKQKVRIVVVDKVDKKEHSGGNQSQTPRPDGRHKKP